MKPKELSAKWRKDIGKDTIREKILDDRRLAELEQKQCQK